MMISTGADDSMALFILASVLSVAVVPVLLPNRRPELRGAERMSRDACFRCRRWP